MTEGQTIFQRNRSLIPPGLACTLFLFAVASATAAPSPAQARHGPQETYRATAYVDGNVAREPNGSVDIVITRWSTPEERNDLLSSLIVKGEQQMRRNLGRQRTTGYVQLATGPRYELRYAWHEPEGALSRIVLISDRIIPFVPAWSSSHAFRYRITSFELRVGCLSGSAMARLEE